MSKKTILFADNNVRFLNEQVEFLEAEGFQVLRAASPREAREKLAEKHIHVAIVDMRLKNDDDANDISGLDFAKDEAYAHISKIMITAYPSWEYAAKILESSEASQILQMLAKPEAETNTQLVEKTKGPFVILDAVEAAFRKIPLNWDLAIRWSGQQTVSVSHLISSIAPRMPLLARYMDEMEDLLRRLFVGSKQINVGDILTGDGGKVYLPIFSYCEAGLERPFLVACGLKEAIVTENSQFDKVVPQNGYRTSFQKYEEATTAHFAATIYQLPGANLDALMTFGTFYQRESETAVAAMLEQLFAETLGNWYERQQFEMEPRDAGSFFLDEQTRVEQGQMMTQLSQLSKELFRTGLPRIRLADDESMEVFFTASMAHALPNPVTYLLKPVTYSYIGGLLHGQLDERAIITNQAGESWMINFSAVRRGPLAYDFAMLETAVKFDLLLTDDPQAYYELEQRLALSQQLDELIQAEDCCPKTQKALKAIMQIRQAAGRVCGVDATPYLFMLFMIAMRRLAGYETAVNHRRSELIPYFRAMISAALLCQAMQREPKAPPIEKFPLRLDEDDNSRIVWRGEQPVELTEREFGLFSSLYAHKNEICRRQELARAAFPDDYADAVEDWEKKALDDGRINTNISRLRQKLEGNSGANYIISIRGIGYRLEPDG